MDAKSMASYILEDNKAPRYVIDLYEGRLDKYTRIGRKIDAVIKTGGVMAGAAVSFAQMMVALKHTSAENMRFAPAIFRDIKGEPLSTEKKQEIATKFKDERRNLLRWQKAMAGALVPANIGASILGSLGLFQYFGRAIDRRKFRKALNDGMHQLIMSVEPEHRQVVGKAVQRIMMVDPFTQTKAFGDSLEHLMVLLRSLGRGDSKYEYHIESLSKFLQ